MPKLESENLSTQKISSRLDDLLQEVEDIVKSKGLDEGHAPGPKRIKTVENSTNETNLSRVGVPRARRGRKPTYNNTSFKPNPSSENDNNQQYSVGKSPSGDTRGSKASCNSSLSFREEKVKINREVKTELDQKEFSCLICSKSLQTISNAKFHYSIHYYDENAYFDFLLPRDLKNGEVQDHIGKVYKYTCPHEECTKRKMGYKEMCVHLATSHEVLEQLMRNDKRSGFREVHDLMYPYNSLVKSESISPSRSHERDNSRVVVDSDIDDKRSHLSNNVSRMSARVSAKKKPCDNSSKVEVKKEVGDLSYSLESDDGEDVDDPKVERNVSNSKTVSRPRSIPKMSSVDERILQGQNYVSQVSNRFHVCLVCNAPGKSNKDGRRLNLGSGIADTKYHYSVCVFNEGGLVPFVDPGQGIGLEFKDLDQYGKKYRYKCPYVDCNKNVGRTKPLGYREYAIHCGVAHHQIERWMLTDDRPGLREVYDAIKAAREAEGFALEELPDVVVEEVHICILCNGGDGDGKNLSFEPEKVISCRYHYASCYYETGVYFSMYPPGDQNSTEEGKPIDVIGRDIKYSCQETGCTQRRKMGYREFAIHMANFHGGVLEVMSKDPRPDVREVAKKLPR